MSIEIISSKEEEGIKWHHHMCQGCCCFFGKRARPNMDVNDVASLWTRVEKSDHDK
jgi:hypothetical protein